MATAALRGLLVAAALALGFFVLSKAFPSADGAPITTPGDQQDTSLTTGAPVSPSPTDKPTRAAPQAQDPSEITLQVLNGTDVQGLASDTAALFEEAGYQISTINDAEASYEVTTLFHKAKRKADAQLLAEAFFGGLNVAFEVADPDIKVDITVNIGADYAATLEEGGEETPDDEAT